MPALFFGDGTLRVGRFCVRATGLSALPFQL